MIELGHVLSADMPISSTRRFDMHTKRTFMNPQSNRRGSNEEVVLSEIGQVGTQFDGFAHQTTAAAEPHVAAGRRGDHPHRVGQLWAKDNARFMKGCPGIGVAAAEWLARQDPMLVGSHNAPVEISPNPDPQISLPVHQIMLVVNGTHLLENLKLDELAAKRVHEFAFVMQPLKLKGATGSTVAPIAIR